MSQYISKKKVQDYLINDIRQSIENDVGIALKAYNQAFLTSDRRGGFFAIPRMLFPEIDGLGSYLTGKPRATGLNIKTYLSEIMGRIDPRYKEYATFIVLVYRHGLLHQHAPKKFAHKHKFFGWAFNISGMPMPTPAQRRGHLVLINTDEGKLLRVNMNTFYQDVLASIPMAAEEIITNHLSEFKKSFNHQNKPLTKTTVLKEALKNRKGDARYIYPRDFKFLI